MRSAVLCAVRLGLASGGCCFGVLDAAVGFAREAVASRLRFRDKSHLKRRFWWMGLHGIVSRKCRTHSKRVVQILLKLRTFVRVGGVEVQFSWQEQRIVRLQRYFLGRKRVTKRRECNWLKQREHRLQGCCVQCKERAALSFCTDDRLLSVSQTLDVCHICLH